MTSVSMVAYQLSDQSTHNYANRSYRRDMEKLCEINRLRAENAMLRALLQAHDIAIPSGKVVGADAAAVSAVSKRSLMADKITLFMSLFQGRADVYARRWEGKNGRAGYSPVCGNEWRKDVCIKPKGKCGECCHAMHLPFDENAVAAHLSGSVCWAFIRC